MSSRACTCFVGNLPGDIREREVEDIFHKYGRIRSIDLKTPPRPPAFCFLEFEDPRDAQEAVRGRDGYDYDGYRLRVELSHGARGGAPAAPPTFRGKGSRSRYRAVIKGLPISASWQDLKDHFRKVVKPSFTNVVRDRGGVLGIVEFDNQDDLDRAIRKLDDTEFRNPFDRAYIRIRDDSDDRGRSRSRSATPPRRERSYTRSRSRSPRQADSRSVSRSRSPAHSRSPSRSRSKGRSVSRSPSKPKASASPMRSRSRSPAASD
ncbi:hypothetical protein WJX74_006119 [Apatococcus lobatus]|uniref:RRM domain-containing protein n=1 Tax=Apatococcus lobatus TaxID=904363 RepID=A0AAW1S5X5_9CHLO